MTDRWRTDGRAVLTAAALLSIMILALCCFGWLSVYVQGATGWDMSRIVAVPFMFFIATLYGWQKNRERQRRAITAGSSRQPPA